MEPRQRIGEFAAAAEAGKTGQSCPATSRDCLPARQPGTPRTAAGRSEWRGPEVPAGPSHRSPPARAGGTAGRWARDVPGSPRSGSPPIRPIRDHHCRSSGRARAVSLGRSLQASCLPLARCWLVFGIPAFTSPATPAPRHGLTPREPGFRTSSGWKTVQAPRFARSQSPFP